ncbi:MAG: hypothetical protein A7316_06585 [Candidatus Altiarchaeales archaeon WOR_SM1_86-2]|nr:MAG: hypothetical protein A7315_13160 [Candidatus Altiarchaeales archaeon WOR_SM1_79]ODS38957.1 MAG: hypothetical protein A7316_06585 [Candidatus Altiarchaeales archaeon WOR_SM1_86-2]
MEDVRNDIKVGDAMTSGIINVKPDDAVQTVAKVMKESDIDSVIVMDKGTGVGIITERDIIWKIVAERRDPEKARAKDIMASSLITISPGDSIEYAAQMMRDNKVRRLPVVSGKKDLMIIGIITEDDIIRMEPGLHKLIEEYSKWDISNLTIDEGTLSGICEICGNYSDDLKSVEGRMRCEDCIDFESEL